MFKQILKNLELLLEELRVWWGQRGVYVDFQGPATLDLGSDFAWSFMELSPEAPLSLRESHLQVGKERGR